MIVTFFKEGTVQVSDHNFENIGRPYGHDFVASFIQGKDFRRLVFSVTICGQFLNRLVSGFHGKGETFSVGFITFVHQSSIW